MFTAASSARLSLLACAVAIALPGLALAEGSERDTPIDEQKQQIAEADLPPAVKDYLTYVQDFDARYPDSGAVKVDEVLELEGEKFALLYCGAIGIDGPCVPDERNPEGGFLAVQDGGTMKAALDGRWWDWVRYLFGNIGVIPDTAFCPSPYAYTFMYMDDENNNNNNNRSGWIGATTSNSNTTWRHCRLSAAASWQFRALPVANAAHGYAVLNMGVFCPPGSTRYLRFQDNQGGSNSNSSGGPIFPNVNVLGRNWLTFTCHFNGGFNASGNMSAFPNLGFKYGVYAPQAMSSTYALQRGWVYQDDEDFLNINYWAPSPPNSGIMNGTNNTWRSLVRVR